MYVINIHQTIRDISECIESDCRLHSFPPPFPRSLPFPNENKHVGPAITGNYRFYCPSRATASRFVQRTAVQRMRDIIQCPPTSPPTFSPPSVFVGLSPPPSSASPPRTA